MEGRAPEQWQPVAAKLDALVDLGFEPEEVFRDWVDFLFFRMMGNRTQSNDVLKKYQGRGIPGTQARNIFLTAQYKMFGCMAKAEGDGLSELYTAYSPPSEPTEKPLPYVLYQALAAVQPHPINERTVTMVLNCRAGGLMVALIERRVREKTELAKYAGQDKNLLCVRMTALNLVWRGVEGLAIWADDQLADIKGIWAVLNWKGLGVIHPVQATDYATVRKIFSKRG